LYVIITGGGVGRRMGGGSAKQFLMLQGKPILLKTIELFKKWREDVHIILVLPSQYKEYWKQYCVENDLWFKHVIVSGGISRFHSVKNALKHVPDGAVVAVHDAVRPFVPEQMLENLLDFKIDVSFDNKTCGVIPVMPSIESMREKSFDADGRVTNTFTVNRDHYMLVQTPQVFDSTVLKKCYQKAYSPLFTDDASVVESGGYKVATVEGSRFNLKITTPEDLKMAEIIMNMNF
ncbi:MAG: 2-C-methyl-D-erythritol 4-phosphate cytidylyltransferase, partial [Bacteroidales bacterium]